MHTSGVGTGIKRLLCMQSPNALVSTRCVCSSHDQSDCFGSRSTSEQQLSYSYFLSHPMCLHMFPFLIKHLPFDGINKHRVQQA